MYCTIYQYNVPLLILYYILIQHIARSTVPEFQQQCVDWGEVILPTEGGGLVKEVAMKTTRTVPLRLTTSYLRTIIKAEVLVLLY